MRAIHPPPFSILGVFVKLHRVVYIQSLYEVIYMYTILKTFLKEAVLLCLMSLLMLKRAPEKKT